MFRKLLVDGRRHFQIDLASEYECSPQTIGRMAAEIESVVGPSLESGIEQRKRYYQIRSINRAGGIGALNSLRSYKMTKLSNGRLLLEK